MTTLIVDLGYSSHNEWGIDKIKIEFSEQDLENIKKHQSYIQENADVFKIVMLFDATYLDENGKEDTDYRTDGAELFIFSDRAYVYSQSKWDCSIQIESEEISNELLFNTNNQNK